MGGGACKVHCCEGRGDGGVHKTGEGGVRRKSTFFDGFLVDNKQDSLFLFFSSYRTVNVVPFYLAVFPYFVVVIIHEKS